MTFDAAVSIYKQTILPLLDYPGFLLIATRKEDKNDFQVLQNDILRICNRTRLSDRVSIPELHSKCKMNSLEQHISIQLLWLMYMLSKDEAFLKVPNRITRRIDRIVFNVPNRILPVYEQSPYCIGRKLWNDLSEQVQESNDVFAFKKKSDSCTVLMLNCRGVNWVILLYFELYLYIIIVIKICK